MSYDPTTFLGLAPGGDPRAPAGTHPWYAATVSALDPEGQFGGGATFRCEPLPGDHIHSAIDCNDRDISGFPINRTLSDLVYGSDSFADLTTPPDFITVYINCNDDSGNALVDIDGYFTACNPSGVFGPECAGGIAPYYVVEFANIGADPGTLLPITDVYGVLNGNNIALEGYLQPASSDFTGDSANTASALLWHPDDIGTMTFRLPADSSTVDFHAAKVAQPGGLVFTVYPFWLVKSQFACFV